MAYHSYQQLACFISVAGTPALANQFPCSIQSNPVQMSNGCGRPLSVSSGFAMLCTSACNWHNSSGTFASCSCGRASACSCKAFGGPQAVWLWVQNSKLSSAQVVTRPGRVKGQASKEGCRGEKAAVQSSSLMHHVRQRASAPSAAVAKTQVSSTHACNGCNRYRQIKFGMKLGVMTRVLTVTNTMTHAKHYNNK